MSAQILQLAPYGGPSATNADFANWLEEYAQMVRGAKHPIESIMLIGASVDGRVSTIGTAHRGITVQGMVGLLHIASLDVQLNRNRQGVFDEITSDEEPD